MSGNVWRHPKNYFNHINSTIEDFKKKNHVLNNFFCTNQYDWYMYQNTLIEIAQRPTNAPYDSPSGKKFSETKKRVTNI